MKQKTLTALRLLLPLLLLAAGSPPSGGLGLIFEQIETMGARQWLNITAGSLVSRAAAAVPVAGRAAHTLSHPPGSFNRDTA
jgi:hypothetical protein